MKLRLTAIALLAALCAAGATHTEVTLAQQPAPQAQPPKPPYLGQPGKDVVWIPQPENLVGRMLDMAGLTPRDFVVDRGSGDGRNVIAAARRGARALGVEYDQGLVEVSRKAAAEAGVADKAQFVQGDMFEADISQASVLALFLIPQNLEKLRPKFLALKPGTRIVSNTFTISEWEADEMRRTPDCALWCDLYMYIVPARAAGTWRLAQGELRLEQKFQMLSGTLSSGGKTLPISEGRLHGDRITFKAGGSAYEGIVDGPTMGGIVRGGRAWSAARR